MHLTLQMDESGVLLFDDLQLLFVVLRLGGASGS
jgi:hypothetical protein